MVFIFMAFKFTGHDTFTINIYYSYICGYKRFSDDT